ncbi:MAG: TVP38/TMEM64 family protein [Planctomycetes bacterium]|nr:TVP38/TMEM64 family protein [Planctomycetota bacterium]
MESSRTKDPLAAQPPVRRRLSWRWPALAALALLILAAAWRWTPLRDLAHPERISLRVEPYRTRWFTPFITVAIYVVGGLVMFPVIALVFASGLAFGPWLGSLYALAGCMASAAVSYGVGHALGHETLEHWAGARIHRISRKLARRGVIAVFLARKVPMAPFGFVNMVAGASHIRFRDFMLGTLLGMGPGVVALSVFGHQIAAALRDPTPVTWAITFLIAALIVTVAILAQRYLGTKDDAP